MRETFSHMKVYRSIVVIRVLDHATDPTFIYQIWDPNNRPHHSFKVVKLSSYMSKSINLYKKNLKEKQEIIQ